MFRTHALWLFGLAFLVACVGACVAPVTPTPEPVPEPTPEPEDPPPSAPPEDLKALAEGNNAFAIDLYKKLAETEQGNIVISPYSIRTALGMTYAGARGQTAEEMKKVLHFTLPDEKLHPAFGATAHQLQGGKDKPSEPAVPESDQARLRRHLAGNNDPFRLNVANALWGQKGVGFRPEFLELNRKNYTGGFRQLDFAGDPEGSRQTINRWVEEKTQDKIKELLKRGDINSAVQLVLTNAIYLKAAWARPFPKGETKDAPFEVTSDEKVIVPMMQLPQADFRYLATYDCEWLELPYVNQYADDRLAMILLLPRKGRFTVVEKSLTAAAIQDAVGKLSFHYGKVAIPKFQVRTTSQLNSELSRLGMPLAFSGDADFSGMTGSRGLQIGRVVHQAYLNVDEDGTEAAAATAVQMFVSRPPPFSFTADRPFLFFIRDNQTGSILFSGRVVRPGR
ncbi:MAG: serpin family protein [Planctomycetia bacterium]|nr:serpin family protein [Planctomycetia bacterium]